MVTLPNEISIIGAGIGGLTTAIILAQSGRKVTVLERRDIAKESGYGIQITPNGTAILDRLSATFRKIGAPAQFLDICDHRNGGVLFRQNLNREPQLFSPYLLFHRADLVNRLLDLAVAANVQLIRGVEVKETIDHQDRVECILSSGDVYSTRYLIAADGLHSQVRTMLNGPDKQAYGRFTAWRSLIDQPQGIGELCTSIQLTVGPAGHLVIYPVQNGAKLNVVAVKDLDRGIPHFQRSQRAKDNWQEEFHMFRGVKSVLDRCETTETWPLPEPLSADTWFGHRCVLIGDALHPMPPFLAQGGNMALEDAWILCHCLLSCETVDDAHQQFRRSREGRIKKVLKRADLQGRLYHAVGIADIGRRIVLGGVHRFVPDLLNKRMSWLFAYNATEYFSAPSRFLDGITPPK